MNIKAFLYQLASFESKIDFEAGIISFILSKSQAKCRSKQQASPIARLRGKFTKNISELLCTYL